MEQDGLYKLLNNQWKTTCRILFGFEVGNLDEYKEWLTELNNPKLVKKSSNSGIETVFTNNAFSENAKFISMDEVDFNKKFPTSKPKSILQVVFHWLFNSLYNPSCSIIKINL